MVVAAGGVSLDHWDMRTGRNLLVAQLHAAGSLDHWDMRTGRNRVAIPQCT